MDQSDIPVFHPGQERRPAPSVMLLDDAVERFVPLDDGTGRYLFDTWRCCIVESTQMAAVLQPGMRRDMVKSHPVWASRGAYYMDEVGFDPSGTDPKVKLNTWRGWAMQPTKGSCDRLLELLQYLCSADPNGQDIYRWLLRWLAYPLQNPGAKMASAVILHGPQGTGKSMFFHALAKIYGEYSVVLNQRALEDKFNSDWCDSKLFILAEEVVARAEIWRVKDELKELITGGLVRINAKNIPAYHQRNRMNFVFLSNEGQPLPLENDDRRHLVVWSPPALSPAFYDEVAAEIDSGGVAALFDYLLRLDLGDFHPKKRPPMTEAKQELIEVSRPSETRFLGDWIAGETGLPVCPCRSTDLYEAYLKWCRANGERPRASNQFLATVAHVPGWQKKRVRVFESFTERGMFRGGDPKWIVFPPEEALQYWHTAMPSEGDVKVWLSQSWMKFRDALHGAKA